MNAKNDDLEKEDIECDDPDYPISKKRKCMKRKWEKPDQPPPEQSQ